jgi:ABC-type Mn2+/Zn2+ transport system ATPase subunit
MKPPPAPGGADHLTPETLLDATGLRLGYGVRTVLDHVAMQVRVGDFWFLVGPNGHGKTTLIHAILRRLQPQAGQLTLCGDLRRPDRIGFVPQHCSLNPALPTTVREFVLLGMVGLRVSRSEETERVVWALDQVGLGGMGTRDYWLLSGGQRQRALVARALVRRPRILIADEPTSGMDLSVETALYESLAELNHRERLTLILVSHDLAVAARYATHISLVHDGGVQAGPATEILRAANLARAFKVPVEVQRDSGGSVNVRLGRVEGPT